MKAIMYSRYGPPDVLQLREVEKPVPKENEVLIQVYAASVNPIDRYRIKSKPVLARLILGNGFLRPKDQRLGVDLAGRVEAVGSSVTRFRPGDEVFGRGWGAFAEYVCTREAALVLKPAATTFEAAAAVPGAAVIALQALRDKGRLRPGQKVLIYGASGGIGTFAVQIAKALGADVTAVCSTRNLDMVRGIGADHSIDYTREDFTRNGQQYDLIVAVNGYQPILAYRRALRQGGICVLVGASDTRLVRSLIQVVLLGPLIARVSRQTMSVLPYKPNQKDLAYIRELLEAGKLKSVIERCYPLAETAEAVRHLEEGHTRGKLVITVDHDDHPSRSLDQRQSGANP